MKVYAIREYVAYEIWDLVEFFLDKRDAIDRLDELNANRSNYSPDYSIEEVEVK